MVFRENVNLYSVPTGQRETEPLGSRQADSRREFVQSIHRLRGLRQRRKPLLPHTTRSHR